MSERYWITGCQLGMLKVFVKRDAVSIRQDIEEILEEIEAKQFIGHWMEPPKCSPARKKVVE